MALKYVRVAHGLEFKFRNTAGNLACRSHNRSNNSIELICLQPLKGDVLVDAHIADNLSFAMQEGRNTVLQFQTCIGVQIGCTHVVPESILASVMVQSDIGSFLKSLIETKADIDVRHDLLRAFHLRAAGKVAQSGENQDKPNE